MEYRKVLPADNGFADEESQTIALRRQVQITMGTAGPNELLDLLVVISNVCEQRALVYQEHPQQSIWYRWLGILLRSALELMSHNKLAAKPQIDLENPILYFPDVEQLH